VILIGYTELARAYIAMNLTVAYFQRTHVVGRAAASTRVLEYSSSKRVVNYSSNFLLPEYSLISTFGCKFPFPVAVFLQPIDEFLSFMETWGFAISFATCQPGNRSDYIHVEGVLRSQQGAKG